MGLSSFFLVLGVNLSLSCRLYRASCSTTAVSGDDIWSPLVNVETWLCCVALTGLATAAPHWAPGSSLWVLAAPSQCLLCVAFL